jgi:predicted DNA-binding ribbon-helix-helix protein
MYRIEMKSAVIKRSIILEGHKTSVSLEDEFWDGLREIVSDRNTSLSIVVDEIDRDRDNCNLSSAIRVYVFNYFRGRLGRQGSGIAPEDSADRIKRSAVAD